MLLAKQAKYRKSGMLTDRKQCVPAQPCILHFLSGWRDRGAADVCQEGAGPIRGDQPETTEGSKGGVTL